MNRFNKLWMPLSAVALFVVALSAPAMSNDSDMDIEIQEPEEQQCLPLVNPPGNTSPAVCNVSIKKDDSCGGAGGGNIVTASSCSDEVTTYPDDACNGEPGKCTEPSTNADTIKSVKKAAAPSLKKGACTSAPPQCSCTVGDAATYQFGRKTCY